MAHILSSRLDIVCPESIVYEIVRQQGVEIQEYHSEESRHEQLFAVVCDSQHDALQGIKHVLCQKSLRSRHTDGLHT